MIFIHTILLHPLQQAVSDADLTKLLAIGGFISGLAAVVTQIIKTVKEAKVQDKKVPVEIKVDESVFAKNATETANLATEARLELEKYTKRLNDKILDLDEKIERLSHSIELLEKKNKKLIKAIEDLMDGISILLEQVKAQGAIPQWTPPTSLSESLKLTLGEKED